MSQFKCAYKVSDNFLKEGLKILSYEAEMLQEFKYLCVTAASKCLELASKNLPLQDWEKKRNAYLESFLLHLRGFREFFEKKRQDINDDTICAEDYGYNISRLKWMSKHRDRLNKQLSHMCYTRESFDSEWDADGLYNNMKNELMKFCNHMLDNRRDLFDAADCVFLKNLFEESKWA